KGIDRWGNSTTVKQIHFYTDSYAPEITQAQPANLASLNFSPSNVSAIYSETGIGLNKTTSQIALNRNGVPISGNTTFVGNQMVFTPTVPLIDGIYFAEYTVEDTFGNKN